MRFMTYKDAQGRGPAAMAEDGEGRGMREVQAVSLPGKIISVRRMRDCIPRETIADQAPHFT